jgi:Zn-dependent M16 (insulinase) family peptidase
VPQEVKPYLPLFAAFLSKLGAKHLSYQALDTEIELNTGRSPHYHNLGKSQLVLLYNAHIACRELKLVEKGVWTILIEEIFVRNFCQNFVRFFML